MIIRVHSCPFVVKKTSSQSGSIFYFILIAIVLIGGLTLALRDSGGLEGNVDRESANVQASQILKYSGEVQRGVQTLLNNGVSENDLRFAYPSAAADYGVITDTPTSQVFSSQGGNTPYRKPPSGSTTTTIDYGFVGNRSMPQAGSAKAELTMNLADVSSSTCLAINKQLGISNIPTVATCGTGNAFNTGYLYQSSPIVIPAASFTLLPALQACMYCTDRATNIYMYTLIAR